MANNKTEDDKNDAATYERSKIRDVIKRYECANPSSTNEINKNKLKNMLLREDCVCAGTLDTLDTLDTLHSYALDVYHLVYYRKHDTVFPLLKWYHTMLKTGVFKTNQYIIKYDDYVDTRQLLAYRALGFGINSNINIVTPIWYYIFNSGPEPGAEPAPDTVNVNPDQLRTLEIQPLLPHSVPLYKWYQSVHISMKDHDFIVTTITLSVAKSIKHCHDKNLVHGDIKPDNIMIVRGPDAPFFTVRRCSVPSPEAYLIDFGMCGRENIDIGTGGTRPYCAPETTNVADDATVGGNKKNLGAANEEGTYNWCKMTKAQDVWSLGLMLFTMVSYGKLYYYYSDFPKRVFDTSGYVRSEELSDDLKIGAHALYPVFAKTLCAPENRASIDEIIQLMTVALTSL